MAAGQSKRVRVGDSVRVKSATEILRTLDEHGETGELQFMPEMIAAIGTSHPVHKSVEKICDFQGRGSRSRRMTDTAILGDLRCSGAAHGGCEAECRFLWRTAWLAPSDDSSEEPSPEEEAAARQRLEAITRANAWVDETGDSQARRYRCQATDAHRASALLPEAEVSQYVRELTAGNVGVGRLARVMLRAATDRVKRKLKLVGDLPMKLGGSDRVDGEKLDLKPGEWVEVRSPEEIGRTLDAHGKHRGLIFTEEMIPACGRRYRVKKRVSRIIHEGTGELLEFKNDCIMLEGMICTGDYTRGAWFCPKEGYPYWREAWLKRAEPPAGP